MTSELDDIKARAAELDKLPGSGDCMGYAELLDRAIAVAEQRITAYDMDVTAVYNTMEHAEREKKRMEDAALTWSARCEVAIRERDKARADAGALRNLLTSALKALNISYAAGTALARCGISLDPDWPRIQDEAYEAVGEFLYPNPPEPSPWDWLADTEHYEQCR